MKFTLPLFLKCDSGIHASAGYIMSLSCLSGSSFILFDSMSHG